MSLYLKYRPRDFSNLVGQDYIRQTIINSIQHDKIAHAYLFCGTRGTGKTSTARILAKSINCLDLQEKGEPCGQCLICKAIDENKLVDLIEIDAASNRGIDEIRELKENIQFTPSQSKKKIYIVDEVHMLTKEAFNALLKTLEEPPEHAYFILATTEVHKIPETIISRCQRFNFRKINLEEMVGRLKYIAESEGFTFEERALDLIAKQANGGMRDAIGLLEQMASEGELKFDYISQNLGLVGQEHIDDFYAKLLEQNTSAALEQINQLVENSYDLAEFNKELVEYLREKMLELVNAQQSPFDVINIIDVFNLAGLELKTALIPQLPLEIAVIKICEVEEISTEKNVPAKKEKKSFFGFSSETKEKKAIPIQKETPPPPPPPPVETTESVSKTNLEKETVKEAKPQASSEVPEAKNPKVDATVETPDFNLELVKNNWQKIIDQVPTAFVKMSLQSGSPTKIEGKKLFITTQSDFYRSKLEDPSGKNEVLIALEKVFQQPIQVEFSDLTVKLQPTIQATKTQKPETVEKEKKPSLNEIAEEVFTFID